MKACLPDKYPTTTISLVSLESHQEGTHCTMYNNFSYSFPKIEVSFQNGFKFTYDTKIIGDGAMNVVEVGYLCIPCKISDSVTPMITRTTRSLVAACVPRKSSKG